MRRVTRSFPQGSEAACPSSVAAIACDVRLPVVCSSDLVRFWLCRFVPVVCCGDLFVILLLYNAMAGRWSAMDPLSVLSDASDSDSEQEEEEEEDDNDDAKQPGSPIHEVACKFFSIFVCMIVVVVFWRYLLRYVITPRELVSHL